MTNELYSGTELPSKELIEYVKSLGDNWELNTKLYGTAYKPDESRFAIEINAIFENVCNCTILTNGTKLEVETKHIILNGLVGNMLGLDVQIRNYKLNNLQIIKDNNTIDKKIDYCLSLCNKNKNENIIGINFSEIEKIYKFPEVLDEPYKYTKRLINLNPKYNLAKFWLVDNIVYGFNFEADYLNSTTFKGNHNFLFIRPLRDCMQFNNEYSSFMLKIEKDLTGKKEGCYILGSHHLNMFEGYVRRDISELELFAITAYKSYKNQSD